MTQEFYNRWVVEARKVRPHQTPPTKEQMEDLLSILTEEQRASILGQFDDAYRDFYNQEDL